MPSTASLARILISTTASILATLIDGIEVRLRVMADQPAAVEGGASIALFEATATSDGGAARPMAIALTGRGASLLAQLLMGRTPPTVSPVPTALEGEVLEDTMIQVVRSALARWTAEGDEPAVVESLLYQLIPAQSAAASFGGAGTVLRGELDLGELGGIPLWVRVAPRAPAPGDSPTPPGRSATSGRLSQLRLPLTLRYGTTCVEVEALSALAPGDLLEFGVSPAAPVELYVGELLIGRARVDLLDDAVELEILEVYL